jgi:hypothetical protein
MLFSKLRNYVFESHYKKIRFLFYTLLPNGWINYAKSIIKNGVFGHFFWMFSAFFSKFMKVFSEFLSKFITAFADFITPPAPRAQNCFLRWFWWAWARMGDFKGGTTNVILRCKTEKPKGKSHIFKSFSDGFRCFEFEREEGVIKSANTVRFFKHFFQNFLRFFNNFCQNFLPCLSTLCLFPPSDCDGFTLLEKMFWYMLKKIHWSSFFYVIFIERMYIKANLKECTSSQRCNAYIRARFLH